LIERQYTPKTSYSQTFRDICLGIRDILYSFVVAILFQTINKLSIITMLYIRDFSVPNERWYRCIPTTKEEINTAHIVAAVRGYKPHINRVVAGCVVNCTLGTVMGATAKDNKGVVAPLLVAVKSYLAIESKTEPFSEAFSDSNNIGYQLLVSNTSFQSGNHIDPKDNPISSNRVRGYLNALNSHMILPAIEQFKNISYDKRFLDKNTGERLVFVNTHAEPYRDTMLYVIDHRIFTASILDGVSNEKVELRNNNPEFIYMPQDSDGE
jgi:hypothetical protein